MLTKRRFALAALALFILSSFAVVGVFAFGHESPSTAYADPGLQVSDAPEIASTCLARWEWGTEGEERDSFSYWTAPQQELRIGTLDLRSLPEQAIPGGIGGWGLFAYSEPPVGGLNCWAGGIDTTLTLSEVNTVRVVLGLPLATRGSSVLGLIEDLYVNHGDPSGENRWKPVRMGASGLRINFAGQLVTNEPFSRDHPAFENTLAVRLLDYDRNVKAGVSLEALERWTGYDMLALHGRRGDDLLPLYVPQEYIDLGHRQRQPETIIGDTFVDSDGTLITAHTATGPNGGFSWAGVINGTNGDIQSSTANLILAANGAPIYRAETDLSSADMYSQGVIANKGSSTNTGWAITARFSSSANTAYYYLFRPNNASSATHRLFQRVAGTYTQIGSSVAGNAPGVGDTVKILVDGDQISGLVNDVTRIGPFTNTNITGHLRAGFGWDTPETGVKWDAFEAADLAAGAAAVALSGTVTDDTEADIRPGGSTIILTVTDDTWVADDGTFAAQRQGIIDGLVSAQSEAAGWNADVQTAIQVTDVVRTSDTIVTITLPAVATYDITVNETITATVPAAALTTSADPVVATPTFTITFIPPTATLTGTVTNSINEGDVRVGGNTIILTLTEAEWVAAGATFDAERQGIIDGLVSDGSETNGWDNAVVPALSVTDVVRTSDTVVTITLPSVASYDVTATENVESTIPSTATSHSGAIVASPTFSIDAIAPSAVLSGTVTNSIDEIDVRNGGLTIILTLSEATWVPDDGTFAAQRQNIINDITSAQVEATGWNAEVRDNIPVGSVVRTSDTVVTVTTPTAANYLITDNETITSTIPASATSHSEVIGATPTFVITDLSDDAFLSNLTISEGTLAPAFDAGTFSYSATVDNAVTSVDVTATVNDPNHTALTIDGNAATSGVAEAVALSVGENPIDIVITAEDGVSQETYTVNITRQSLDPSVALTGTITDSVNEGDIRDGARTIILTVTNDTWVAAGGTFDAQRQSIIDGLTSAQSEAAGWNAEVKTSMAVTDVVRTSDAIVTITLPAVAAYDITQNEIVTATVPGSALVTFSDPVVATPTFTITPIAPTAALTGTVTDSITEIDVRTGGKTIILTLTEATWQPTGEDFNNQRQAIIDGITSAQSEEFGWNNTAKQDIVVTDVVRTSDTIVTITLSESSTYKITSNETVTATIPAAATTHFASIVASPSFTITSLADDATLSNLTVSVGTLTPGFDAGVFSYTVSVANEVESLDVTPTINDSNATLTVNAEAHTSGTPKTIALNVGENIVTIAVTAEDEISTETYTITITRQAISSDATLSALSTDPGTLDPAFDAGTTSYTVNVANGVTSIGITATVNDANHTSLTIDGNPATSGVAETVSGLAVGSNPVAVVVVAEDGVTDETYTVDVVRAAPEPCRIINVALAAGAPNEPYSATINTADCVAPVTFATIVGALPDGLTLDENTGEISGTPTQVESQTFTVQVTDDAAATATKELTLNIRVPGNATFFLFLLPLVFTVAVIGLVFVGTERSGMDGESQVVIMGVTILLAILFLGLMLSIAIGVLP